MTKQKNTVVYVINSLDPGGAEMGLELLIDNGLFNDVLLNLVVISRSGSDLEKRIAQKIGNNIHFLSEEPISNKKLLTYAFALKKMLRRLKPDVVVSALTQSVLIARFARLTQRFKHITFEHNTEFQNKAAYMLTRRSDFLTDFYWCDSGATERALLARNPKARQMIVPLFFAQTGFAAKSDFVPGPVFRVMSVGRLMAQKNYPQSLQAIKLLRQRGINATLDIFGGGELKDELAAMAAREGISEAIHFRGFVQYWQQEAHQYDAYLLSSGFEGLSIATLEAMGAGLPCVVRQVGELANYIVPRQNGLFAGTADEAARALADIYGDPELAKTLGENARHYVNQNHSEVKFAGQMTLARMEIGSA